MLGVLPDRQPVVRPGLRDELGGVVHVGGEPQAAAEVVARVLDSLAPAEPRVDDRAVADAAGAGLVRAPEPRERAWIFAPVGTLCPGALGALDRAGTTAIAGIHLSDIPSLNYERHLFRERTVTSTTANTRRDGEEFLALAERIPLRIEVTEYPLGAADRALRDLAEDRVNGAAVLRVAES